ncbi:hypothetical protein MOC32_14105 [Bacillus spizizenii]|nr:hypothetical protein [Bacillus spizizenii]
MSRLVGELFASLIVSVISFIVAYLLLGFYEGLFFALLTLVSSVSYWNGVHDGEKKERDKQRIKWK